CGDRETPEFALVLLVAVLPCNAAPNPSEPLPLVACDPPIVPEEDEPVPAKPPMAKPAAWAMPIELTARAAANIAFFMVYCLLIIRETVSRRYYSVNSRIGPMH